MDNKQRDQKYYSRMVFELQQCEFDKHIKLLRYGIPDGSGFTVLRCMDDNLIKLRDMLNDIEFDSEYKDLYQDDDTQKQVYLIIEKSYYQPYVGGNFKEISNPRVVFESYEDARNFIDKRNKTFGDYEIEAIEIY